MSLTHRDKPSERKATLFKLDHHRKATCGAHLCKGPIFAFLLNMYKMCSLLFIIFVYFSSLFSVEVIFLSNRRTRAQQRAPRLADGLGLRPFWFFCFCLSTPTFTDDGKKTFCDDGFRTICDNGSVVVVSFFR